jgi:hypothetical protein
MTFDSSTIEKGSNCDGLDEALGYYGYSPEVFEIGEISFGYEAVSTGDYYGYPYTVGYHWWDYYGYGWYPSYYYSGYTIDWDLDEYLEFYQATYGYFGVIYTP